MSLETAGNIAALFGGAVKGYQDQSEIELKKQQLARDEELKRLQIEAGLMEKGLIKSANGGWEYSPEELDKRKLDRDYKQAQIGATEALAEYRKTGGNDLKSAQAGFEKDPLGNLVESDYLKRKRQLELDYQAAQAKKSLGLVNVPEAASVEAKNKVEADLKSAELLEKGFTLLPDGKWLAPDESKKPWNKEEQDVRKYYREELGVEFNPRTGKKEKIEGWRPKKENKPKEKTIIEDTMEREIAKKVAVQATIHSQIMPVIKTFEDPNISEKQKIAAGDTIAKSINSSAGSWDAVTGGEAERALGQLDILPNKHKLKFGADTQEFLKSIKNLNKRIANTISSNERILKGVRSGVGVSGLIEKDNIPVPPDKKENEPPVMSTDKVIRAKSVLSDPKATEKAKLGARKYLNQLGVK